MVVEGDQFISCIRKRLVRIYDCYIPEVTEAFGAVKLLEGEA